MSPVCKPIRRLCHGSLWPDHAAGRTPTDLLVAAPECSYNILIYLLE
jgi:hypothetical protein